ncbi:MAG: CPBP family intramembrane metalloprotease [Bacteroidetes bacterium]|nr:MAG: CPBP family intramembrane metalloprotease [Bacteroidota bacterium]
MLQQLIQQLRKFVAAYPFTYWVVMLLFCAIGVYSNYFMGLKQWMKPLTDGKEFLAYFILYTVHTLWGFIWYSVFFKEYAFWKKVNFWLLLLAGLGIFAFRVSFDEHYHWIANMASAENVWVYQSIFKHFFKQLYLMVPIFLLWLIADSNNQPFYGFSSKQHKAKLYWGLLLAMVPLVAYASTQADFLDFYPRASKISQAGVSTSMLLLFEFFYGLDFISIELFFRGFMIMAFTRFVGIHAVLPMACFYLSIHYGKPMGEAISSFFGGTILGVIAYHSKSIYGGIMVHMGIAWLMELGGFIGNYFRQ